MAGVVRYSRNLFDRSSLEFMAAWSENPSYQSGQERLSSRSWSRDCGLIGGEREKSSTSKRDFLGSGRAVGMKSSVISRLVFNCLLFPNFIFRLLNCLKVHFLLEFLIWRYWWKFMNSNYLISSEISNRNSLFSLLPSNATKNH